MADCPLDVPVTPSPKGKRGAGYFAFAGGVFLVGVIAAGLFLVWVGGDMRGQIHRGSGRGDIEITLPESGTYVVYHEYATVLEGHRVERSPQMAPGSVTLEAAGGETVATRPPRKAWRYTLGKRRGLAVAEADIPAAGVYRLHSELPDVPAGAPPFVFVLARDLPARIRLSFVGTLLILSAFAMTALAMIGTTVKHRVIARRVDAVARQLAEERGLAPPESPVAVEYRNPVARED